MITGSQHFKVKAHIQRNNNMDFIKKVYSICCYTNAQPEDFGTDIIPMECHNRMIDLDKTVQNVEQVCDLILWRTERLSRLFSGCFRHDPKQGNHRECRRQVEMNPDGSVELYDALGCITHARNFMGNKPRLLLMAMFPDYGKARFEIAFVYPSVDGSYNERKDKGCIVPTNRWIDNLTSRSACDALRPDGREFLNDPEMECYVRCNSGHTRQVDLQYFGRPLWPGQKSEPRQEEPDYDLPTESIPPSPHPSRSDAPHEDEGTAQAKSRMRRPAPPSIEEERKIKPFAKKPVHVPYNIWRSADQHHGERAQIWEIPVKPFGESAHPHGMRRQRYPRRRRARSNIDTCATGRDALLILAFLKDQDYGIRLSEERTALTEQTIEAKNMVAAFDPDGNIIRSLSVVKTLRCTTPRSMNSPMPSSNM